MLKPRLAVAALVLIGLAACPTAAGASEPALAKTSSHVRRSWQGFPCVTKFPDGVTQAQVDDITASMGATHGSCLAENPSDCEPDDADPVWGPHQELVGFSCFEAPSGRH
ncbi:MAG: hypothetical protein ACLPN5_03055 [Roseiarcus sp.]